MRNQREWAWKNLTVAGNDKKLVFVGDVVYGDIGISSDDLSLGNQGGVFFELKIAQRPR
jgi:hypothetical protein